MTKYNFSIQTGKDTAHAVGRALPISTKTSSEVCTMIRGKQVERAIRMLEEVTREKLAVPFIRCFKDIGHRKGNLTSGGFPVKAAAHILSIVKSARSNAESKGLNTKELVVTHSSAQQGGRQQRGGRHGRTAKRTHIEIVVQELKQEKKSPKKESSKGKSQ